MSDQRELFALAPAAAPPAELSGDALRGLTLWQPWAHAVAHLGKRVENRPWKPPSTILGRLVAIHAAARRDEADELRAEQFIRTAVGLDVPAASTLSRGTIVAIARVTGFVTKSTDPWFFGPYGWQLTDVVALPEPIPCRGMQGLWPVPAHIGRVVIERWRAARGGDRG